MLVRYSIFVFKNIPESFSPCCEYFSDVFASLMISRRIFDKTCRSTAAPPCVSGCVALSWLTWGMFCHKTCTDTSCRAGTAGPGRGGVRRCGGSAGTA